MADLITVATFFENRDAHADFRIRFAAGLVSYARQKRNSMPSSPTDVERARQNLCVQILSNRQSLFNVVDRMLPTIAVIANNAGFLDDQGVIAVTDQQITDFIDDNTLDLFSGYVPEVAA